MPGARELVDDLVVAHYEALDKDNDLGVPAAVEAATTGEPFEAGGAGAAGRALDLASGSTCASGSTYLRPKTPARPRRRCSCAAAGASSPRRIPASWS